MENVLLISDAAKEVKVESHVLRYWEEELHLPIKRNELGHRYYTKEDVERFRQIKNMKEKGLQLKAIKMLLKDEMPLSLPIDIVSSREINAEQNEKAAEVFTEESREEKAKRLQWLLRQLIRETLQENNQELCKDIKESIVKELDYQFRTQEEREEERERMREQRNEEYYQKMDALLRKKSRGRENTAEKKEKEGKKKRHSIF